MCAKPIKRRLFNWRARIRSMAPRQLSARTRRQPLLAHPRRFGRKRRGRATVPPCKGLCTCLNRRLSLTRVTRSPVQAQLSLRQHGTQASLYFVFALCERKNEIQKEEK